MSQRRYSLWRTALLIALTVPFVYPFAFLVVTAIRTDADYARSPVGLPGELTFENVRAAWNGAGLSTAFLNSFIAVTTGVAVCCVLSSCAAFWFYRHRNRVGNAFLAVVVGSQALPWVLWIIPTFILLSNLALINNLFMLGVLYGTLYTPFATWFLWSYLKNGVSLEVLEAAQMDGASLLQQLTRVVVPLSTPALGTIAALTFVWMWGDLLLAVILLQDPAKFTAVVGAATLVGQFRANVQESAAAALLVIVPMLVVFLIAQRAIVRGFTAGIGR